MADKKIGVILPFEDQKDQLEGNSPNACWRYRVAILGKHSFNDAEIGNKEIRYVNVALGCADGSGGGNRSRSARITQGDVVLVDYVEGEPFITNVLGRTQDVKFGSGRFSSKTGLDVGNTKANILLGRQEFNQQTGCTTPLPLPKGAPGSDTTTCGTSVILADPCKNNFFAIAEMHLQNFFSKVTGPLKSTINIGNEIKKVSQILADTSRGFANSITGSLGKKLTEFIKKGLANQASKITEKFKNVPGVNIVGEIIKGQTKAIDPAKLLFGALFCASTKVIDSAANIFSDLLTKSVDNIISVPACAVTSALGAFANKAIDIIDSIVTPLLEPLETLFEITEKAKDIMMGSVDIMKKLANIFSCGGDEKCPATSKYTIDKGPDSDRDQSSQDKFLNAVFSEGALSRGAANLADDFEREYGKWSIFGVPIDPSLASNVSCYTGPVFRCGSPKVQFFGGDGTGGAGKVILGRLIDDLDQEDLIGSISKTASIVGVEITDPGSGYTTPPLISFTDSCDQGYGAYGRAIIDRNFDSPTYGQITGVTITSGGENYPSETNDDDSNINEDGNVYIDKIIIEDGGIDYSNGDNIPNAPEINLEIDDDGRVIGATLDRDDVGSIVAYNGLPNLNISSSTGFGAVLKPIMRNTPPSKKVLQIIDCVK